MQPSAKTRVGSIDLLRGLVMIIMALDHVRDYFHYDAYFYDPSDLGRTTALLFWTRFVTHFCAPVFVFLAGTSAFFVGQRRSKPSLSKWLLKRGIWLIIAELTIIKFAWTFSLDYSTILLQVIWALGIGMVFLALCIHLPKNWVIGICILGIAGHNLLDGYMPSSELAAGIWSFLHVQNILTVGIRLFIAYPLVPWIFVMPLGYYFGRWYHKDVQQEVRIRHLFRLGLLLTLFFVVLRFLNFYGDPTPWADQETLPSTVLSFFNVTKYPPSLLFLLITLGPAILLLGFAEKWKGALASKLIVVGRVPMFFYIVHIYAIHLLALLAAVMSGYDASDMVISIWVTFEPQLQGYGFDLWLVYSVWIFVVIALYPLCSIYYSYKSSHRHLWWLSYL
jgi:uncharacterized membrane protein